MLAGLGRRYVRGVCCSAGGYFWFYFSSAMFLTLEAILERDSLFTVKFVDSDEVEGVSEEGGFYVEVEGGVCAEGGGEVYFDEPGF